MSKKIAILQSNYIPWKGYFDIIAAVDEFVIFDDMQFTRRDWRNRNLIKTPQGTQWLTVPVKVKSKYHQLIKHTEIDGEGWIDDHLKGFVMNYKKAPFFDEVYSIIEPIYLKKHSNLSEMNIDFLRTICNYLNIKTQITYSWNYQLADEKTERLLGICLQAGGIEYISGAAAKDYLDEKVFAEKNVKVSYFEYTGYKEYSQLWGEFTHQVTILDLLFNCGPSAKSFMKCGSP